MIRRNLFPLFDLGAGTIMYTTKETKGSRAANSCIVPVLFSSCSLFLAQSAHIFIIMATLAAMCGQYKRFFRLAYLGVCPGYPAVLQWLMMFRKFGPRNYGMKIRIFCPSSDDTLGRTTSSVSTNWFVARCCLEMISFQNSSLTSS